LEKSQPRGWLFSLCAPGQALTRSALSASKLLAKEGADQARVTQQKALDEYNKTLAELVAADPNARTTAKANAKPWWRFW
jgi:hypothetical protein